MSAVPKHIIEEVRLLRETGHPNQCLRLIDEVHRCAPDDQAIIDERQKALAYRQVRFKRLRRVMTDVVDFLGPPAVFVLMLFVALLLAPILFVPAW